MPFDADLIPQAVTRYRRERDRYVKLADRIAGICRDEVCEQNAIRAQVTFRVKTEKSFEVKLKRLSQTAGKNYSDVDQIFAGINDLAGVRIAAYRLEDCERIVEHLKRACRGPQGEIEIDRKDKKSPNNENYYRAIHAQVSLPEDQQIGTYDNVGDISCEIQICTMIAHVWNEIEHDIGYKPELGAPSADEQYHLAQFGRLVRQGDLLVSSLVAAHEQRVSAKPTEDQPATDRHNFVDVHDFVSRMRDFGGSQMMNFSENSGQLLDLLIDLNLASPQSLLEVIKDFDPLTARAKIDSFNSHLTETGVDGVYLDSQTSDLLLVALLDRKLPEIMTELKGRAGRGRGRPSRLHRIAVRYQTFLNR